MRDWLTGAALPPRLVLTWGDELLESAAHAAQYGYAWTVVPHFGMQRLPGDLAHTAVVTDVASKNRGQALSQVSDCANVQVPMNHPKKSAECFSPNAFRDTHLS